MNEIRESRALTEFQQVRDDAIVPADCGLVERRRIVRELSSSHATDLRYNVLHEFKIAIRRSRANTMVCAGTKVSAIFSQLSHDVNVVTGCRYAHTFIVSHANIRSILVQLPHYVKPTMRRRQSQRLVIVCENVRPKLPQTHDVLLMPVFD